nr:ACT domain-containing protein [uncultured Undibacterium sp.]
MTISDLDVLLKSMNPVLNEGQYVFVTAPANCDVPWDDVLASIREPEGLSIVLALSVAQHLGLTFAYPFAWITLQVNSDLAAVGLTAAFSRVLGHAGISCNVVAGNQHDHIFVPFHQAQMAMENLLQLQRSQP